MLIDQMLNQQPRLDRDFGELGDAPTRGAGIRIDAGEPGDQAAAQQRQGRGTVLGDGRVRIN